MENNVDKILEEMQEREKARAIIDAKIEQQIEDFRLQIELLKQKGEDNFNGLSTRVDKHDTDIKELDNKYVDLKYTLVALKESTTDIKSYMIEIHKENRKDKDELLKANNDNIQYLKETLNKSNSFKNKNYLVTTFLTIAFAFGIGAAFKWLDEALKFFGITP